jgi:hypothetical protein
MIKDLVQYIPAALFNPAHSGTGVYIKYHALRNEPPKLLKYKTEYTHLDTPDRELLLVNDNNRLGNTRPLDEGFDEFVSFSPMHLSSKDSGMKWGMMNYLQNLNPKYNHHFMDAYKDIPDRVKIISDSGGFQLSRGSVSFINPEKLAIWYSTTCDVGMTLDVPLGREGSSKYLKESGKIQKKNNEKMLETFSKLNSPTKLMNVLHGLNESEYELYHKIVYEPTVDKLAIGGVYHSSLVTSTKLIYNLMFESDIGKHYNHVHILGVFNNKILPIYYWIFKLANEKRKKPILLTSDSSTAIQQAVAKTYFMAHNYDEPYQFQKLGTTFQTGHLPSRVISSPFRTLNCCCPVCAALKYTDLFTFCTGQAINSALTYHNNWQFSRYTNFMNEMLQKLDFEQYRDLVARQIGKRASRDTLDALDFVNHAHKHGLKSAHSRFHHYFRNLFSFSKELAEEKTIKKKRDEFLVTVFDKYNKYHKTGKAPETVKIMLDKKVGNLAQKSTSSNKKAKKISIKK